MENYLSTITNYLLTQSWQIAVLVVLIAAVTLALKNRSAHIRYLLWLIVLAKCLAPPLVTIPLAILPQDKMPEPTLISNVEMPAANVEMADAVTSEPIALPSVPVTSPTIMEKLARLSARQWLGFGWIVGVAAFLLFAVIKALRTNFWLWRQRKLLPAELQIGIDNLFSGLGIKTLPKVWLVEGIGQPFVWGLPRGSIYLPADFGKVNSAEHRRGVLGHELGHILRFDAAVNILQIIAQAIFWFHPFVWWANRKIRAEREKCCDEMAIARLGAKAKDYSSAIVDTLIVEHESTRPVPSLAVAGPVNSIEERIKTIMKPGKKFFKRPSLVTATVVLLLGLLTVPTALVLTARAEAKTAPEREEGLARDTFVQPTERDVDESREEGGRGRREVEKQERPRPEVWARELSQHRRELQERELRIERELEGLRDDQDEEARELHAELRQIREKLHDIERELRVPKRERREAETPAPELLQRRRELAERAHQIERELERLRDDQDKEARELQAELREIRMQVADIERELRGPERERQREPERQGRAIRSWPEDPEKERELLPAGRVWHGEADQLQELFGRLLGYMKRMERELMELREDNARLKGQLQERGQFPRERGREIRERREDSERGEPELRRGRRERERAKEPEEAREQD